MQPEVISPDGAARAAAPLLAPHEPSPYRIEHAGRRAPMLFTCDHASWAVPESLANLGLPDSELQRHIGWDRGAEEATLRLAERFSAPAILTHYSRLVIDCNRAPRTPESIPETSDQTRVPGNLDLSPEEVARREDALFKPYHAAITQLLDEMRQGGATPVYIAMHTFTATLNGSRRPWDFGVLWDHDSILGEPLIAELRSNSGVVVGDNEPYSAKSKFDYSRMQHASLAELPYALVEIREDLLAGPRQVEYFVDMLADALERALDAAHCQWQVS